MQKKTVKQFPLIYCILSGVGGGGGGITVF